jgi:glycosyltransferase involved in cell wall biosynthesis
VSPAGDSIRVAVVVPCFNDGAVLPEALGSLVDQEPVELVLVDDASTDEATARILDEQRARGVTVIRHAVNAGLSAARMTGVRATSSPFVFPLDADDLVAPGALARLADLLESHPAAAVAFADYEEFGVRARVVAVPARLDPFRIAYRNEYPVASLFRREALDRVGGWRDVAGLVGYEDWNLWMALAEDGAQGLRGAPGEVALRRRIHGNRMLADAGRRHRELYGHLRRLHPSLFADIRRHRRASDLDRARKLLYPVLFGGRPPLGIWSRVQERRGRS